jgi:hypothetical protein
MIKWGRLKMARKKERKNEKLREYTKKGSNERRKCMTI